MTTEKLNRRWTSAASWVGKALALAATLLSAAHAQQFSDWSAPVNLGATINSAFNDSGSFVSKDGLSLYYGSTRPGGHGALDIYVSRRASTRDPWGPPQNLGPTINTAAAEQTVGLSADGRLLYFASDRPGGFGGLDLYVSRREDKNDDLGWGPPVNLGSGVNMAEPEFFGSIFKDRRERRELLYFARGAVGARDLYVAVRGADGSFGAAVPIVELNGAFDDARPMLRRDGLEMYFDSNRPGGHGVGATLDIWVTTRARTWHAWSPPVNVGVLNTEASEVRPSLSFDSTALYFQSSRPGGFGDFDLYVSTRTRLDDDDDDNGDDDD